MTFLFLPSEKGGLSVHPSHSRMAVRQQRFSMCPTCVPWDGSWDT
jgi:hypothetical protein